MFNLKFIGVLSLFVVIGCSKDSNSAGALPPIRDNTQEALSVLCGLSEATEFNGEKNEQEAGHENDRHSLEAINKCLQESAEAVFEGVNLFEGRKPCFLYQSK
jgi:hypothetical protein